MRRKLTREEAIDKTFRQWTWTASALGLNKAEWPQLIEDKKIFGDIRADCYLCEYVSQQSEDENEGMNCTKYCPLEWPGKTCDSHFGLWKLWAKAFESRDYVEAQRIAEQIAKLATKPKSERLEISTVKDEGDLHFGVVYENGTVYVAIVDNSGNVIDRGYLLTFIDGAFRRNGNVTNSISNLKLDNELKVIIGE